MVKNLGELLFIVSWQLTDFLLAHQLFVIESVRVCHFRFAFLFFSLAVI